MPPPLCVLLEQTAKEKEGGALLKVLDRDMKGMTGS